MCDKFDAKQLHINPNRIGFERALYLNLVKSIKTATKNTLCKNKK